jgi:hypothetical protein
VTSPYENLQKLVRNREITVVHIDAVPRSMSTVLEISCTQLADAQVNEPFNRGRCDLDAAAEDVINAASTLTTEGPLMIVTKTIASEIDPYFAEWMSICNSVIFAVRHPLIQMASLLERLGNDSIVGRGTSAMDFLGLEPFAAQVDAIASKNDFRRAAWRELLDHYRESAQNPKLATMLVDGATLSRSPETVLGLVAAHIGRPFGEQYAASWTTGARVHFNNPNHFASDLDGDGISINAWVRRAHQSTRLEPDQRRAMCLRYWLQHYPLSHRYLIEHAIPTYELMVVQQTSRQLVQEQPLIDDLCQARHPYEDCVMP